MPDHNEPTPYFDDQQAIEHRARRIEFLSAQAAALTAGIDPAMLRTLALLLLQSDAEAAALSEIRRIVETFSDKEEGWLAVVVALQVAFGKRLADEAAERSLERYREIREAFLGLRDPATVRPVK